MQEKEKTVCWKLKGLDTAYCENPYVPFTIELTLDQTINAIVNGTIRNRCKACNEVIVTSKEITVSMLNGLLQHSSLVISEDREKKTQNKEEDYNIYYSERDGIDPSDYIGTVKAINKEMAIDIAELRFKVHACDILARKRGRI